VACMDLRRRSLDNVYDWLVGARRAILDAREVTTTIGIGDPGELSRMPSR
jgi:hypothetical protein